MRRANGSGSVYKLSGKRHKPWTARVTTGWNEQGYPIYKYIGYFLTKKEAQEALTAYFFAPEKAKTMTLEDAFAGWEETYTGAKGTIAGYRSAYKKMHRFWKTQVSDLDLEAMQEMVDEPPATYATGAMVKRVLSAIISFAIANEVCHEGKLKKLEFLKLPERPSSDREAFTDEEIYQCIHRSDLLPIILIFTGLRRQELLDLRPEDIDLEGQTLNIRKSKTSNGVRIVPIPTRLLPWMEKWKISGAMGHSKTWVLDRYWTSEVCQRHTPHECRHTYISLLQRAQVDERIVKSLCGHSGGLTLDTYTHYRHQEMLEVVDKAFEQYLPMVSDQTDLLHGLSA